MKGLTPSDRDFLRTVRNRSIDHLASAIRPNQPVALLDFPMHNNIGDHLIFAGELTYLDSLGANVAYVADVRRFDESHLRKIMPQGTILITGGGNFGDIWPAHQHFRRDVVARFPDYRIVQLPQTVYYQDPVESRLDDRIFGSHPDFSLLLRDHASIHRVSQGMPNVSFSYLEDMALGWQPPIVTTSGSGDSETRVVVLARQDKEGTGHLLRSVEGLIGPTDLITDWTLSRREQTKYWSARVPAKLWNSASPTIRRVILERPLGASYLPINQVNLLAGIKLFANASAVITDRLHALVLASLMGIPAIAMDNSYGKISAIYNEYLFHISVARMAKNAQDIAVFLDEVRGSAT